MARYALPPGTPVGDAPTEFTHIALPRDATQAAEWAAEAGHPVAGRVEWPMQPVFMTPEQLAQAVDDREFIDGRDPTFYREPWEGD